MISVVIPTYKNVEQLIKNMRHNLPYLQRCEVVIVNDFPGKSIKAALAEFTGITLIENERNLGFAGAVHVGIAATHNPYVMLLNSDVLLFDTTYTKAEDQLQSDPTLFAISFKQMEKDGSPVGKNRMYWDNGFLQHAKAGDIESGITGWAEGGSCMINRSIYDTIGGFDSLFSPFYWEDIDLSYRAWKRGYQVLFDASISVEHHHESTIGTHFAKERIRRIATRNQFIFMWKNITDPSLRIQHAIRLIAYLPLMLIKDSLIFFSFLDALFVLPTILRRRESYSVTDAEILSKFI